VHYVDVVYPIFTFLLFVVYVGHVSLRLLQSIVSGYLIVCAYFVLHSYVHQCSGFTARSELRKVLFWRRQSVVVLNFLCTKYFENRGTALRQIHMENVFDPSLARV